MARSPYTQLDYSGIATVQALTDSGGINASATTFHIASAATWLNSSGYYLGNGPTNTPGSAPFVVAIDYNTINEEKVLCSSVTSGGLVTVLQRGYDGTTAIAHNSTTINCVPVFSATEAREANTAVSNTIGQVTAAGDILYGTGTNAMDNLAIGAQGTTLAPTGSTPPLAWRPGLPYTLGTNGQVLTSNGTTPVWATPSSTLSYAAGHITTNVALTNANTRYTWITTSSLATGYWQINATCEVSSSVLAYAAMFIPTSSNYTIVGPAAIESNTGGEGYITLSLSTIIQVTTAGTVAIDAQCSGANATVLASGNWSLGSEAGYTAIKVA